MKEIIINKENFEKEVLQSTKPVLVDFWADWCGPCKMLSPVISQLADEYSDKITVGKINVTREPEFATEYNISSVPALMLFENGKVIKSSVGFMSLPQIIDSFNI